MGCHFLLQGIFLTQGSNLVSFIAGIFFTIWATRDIVVIDYYQGRIIETSLPLVPHKFLANLRDSEFAFRSHLDSILASTQILGWEGNYTILWVYEKLPTCIWIDCLYCYNMLWVQGLKSWTNSICFLNSYFPLILSFTCIATLFTNG